MKNRINKIVRKILFWLFKDKIIAYANSMVISDLDIVHSKGDIVDCVKEKIVHQIGMKLLADKVLEIEEESFPGGRRYIVRLYVLKTPKP